MVSRRYSGYLADDESLKRPQVRNVSSSPRRNLLRPPSCCQFQDQDSASSVSAFSTPTQGNERKTKRDESTSRERRHVAKEFAEFVDFLADEEVLDSLQDIMEDAVRKLRNVTTEEGEHLFDLREESSSSPDSAAWSLSYSHRHVDSNSARSRSKYTTTTLTTTTTSSSEDDWERRQQTKRQPQPDGKVCLLDKYAARIPKLEKTMDRMSGGFHAEMFSERSGDSYYFHEEYFHAWAKLAESFQHLQAPKKDYFSKFKKEVPAQTFSAESLHKEITNVLKRPTPSSLLLYHPGHQPFEALDFLEENKILAALQDIINQAVCKVLEVTSMTDGLPLFSIFDEQGQPVPWDTSAEGSEEEEESGSEVSGSGEETSEGDSKSEEGTSVDGGKKKKKKRKGRRKKKKGEAVEEEKGKQKYTPPPLPKSKRRATVPEEPQRKPKYVPPPLPKTKPRPPPEEPAPKPKYVPPPLPKPRQKKQDLAQGETEAQQKQKTLAKHIVTTKDIKRARLEARPAPKQAVIDFLIENAAKLILYKYNYETLLSEKLGFVSVPVTKVLLEIMFGYKRIKGSGIRLSSQIDWSKVYDEIYAPRPPRPKTPKHKGDDKKKAGGKKKVGDKKKMAAGEKQRTMKPHFLMPSGKVVVTKAQIKSEVEGSKTKGSEFTPEHDVSEGPEIYEIVPPQFPEESPEKEESFAEEGSEIQPLTPTNDSPKSSMKLGGSPPTSEVALPSISPKQSSSLQKPNIAHHSSKGSMSVLPEVEPTGQSSGELLKKASSSQRSGFGGEGSKKSSNILPKISN